MRPPPGLPLRPFPWDRLVPLRARASCVPGGLVDLSVGTPVDPVPPLVREALAAAADAPGYPTALGTAAVREAGADWLRRRLDVRADPGTQVLPTTGSKEVVGLLPWLLGLRPGDRVLHPSPAYPTYDVGARLAGAEPVAVPGLAAGDLSGVDPSGVGLVWVNSPSNPTGRVSDAAALARVAAWGRGHGVPVVSDECYVELGWEESPVSLLSAQVAGGALDGLLALHSLSKRSNLAGYRAGLLSGDAALVGRVLELRRQAGLLVPAPVQAAAAAALRDDAHVRAQREVYGRRRAVLLEALAAAGFRREHSTAGLYLWVTRPGWTGEETLARLADSGVLVAPGDMYGAEGEGFVRVALTAPDERVALAAERLARLGAGSGAPAAA